VHRTACWIGVLVLASISPFVASCGDNGTGLPGTCSLDFSSTVDSNFGDPRIDNLLEATARFNVAATNLEDDVRTACNNINTDLGAETSMDTETACMNADQAIRDVLMAEASVTLTVEYVPAVCTASASAVAECAAMCDAEFDASATPPTCEGGMLSGGCSGECSGSCTVEGMVDCMGSCQGTCSGMCSATIEGTCEGTCMGQCDGTCSMMDGDGNCMGTCDGTCSGQCMGTVEGSCSGTCEGSCMGSCRAEVTGMCEGRCTGMCDVMFEEPRCEGGELNVEANAECSASCEAEASFELECTEPEIIVSFTGSVSNPDDLQALAATLRDNLGTLIAALEKAQVMVDATVELGGQVEAAVDAIGDASVEAIDCLRNAVTVYAEASASVNVSVSASASVSGSASGGT